MPGKGLDRLSGLNVPQLDASLVNTHRQPPAVGARASGAELLGFDGEESLPRPDVPHASPAGGASSVRAQGHAGARDVRPLRGERLLVRQGVPDLDCPVLTGAGQAKAVRAEANVHDAVLVSSD